MSLYSHVYFEICIWIEIFEIDVQQILLQVFPGNYDRHSIVTHEFVPAFHARLVKIHPLSYNNWMSMRIELYGCPIKVRLGQDFYLLNTCCLLLS